MNSSVQIGEAGSEELAELELSVIVPARNEALALPRCLASILSQSEPGFALGAQWEVIVVNDDSSDGTREIAEAAAAGHRRGDGDRCSGAGFECEWRVYREDECVLGGGADCSGAVLAVYRCGYGA